MVAIACGRPVLHGLLMVTLFRISHPHLVKVHLAIQEVNAALQLHSLALLVPHNVRAMQLQSTGRSMRACFTI
jgi:hypothetical protein